jgi:hypothetical protein
VFKFGLDPARATELSLVSYGSICALLGDANGQLFERLSNATILLFGCGQLIISDQPSCDLALMRCGDLIVKRHGKMSFEPLTLPGRLGHKAQHHIEGEDWRHFMANRLGYNQPASSECVYAYYCNDDIKVDTIVGHAKLRKRLPLLPTLVEDELYPLDLFSTCFGMRSLCLHTPLGPPAHVEDADLNAAADRILAFALTYQENERRFPRNASDWKSLLAREGLAGSARLVLTMILPNEREKVVLQLLDEFQERQLLAKAKSIKVRKVNSVEIQIETSPYDAELFSTYVNSNLLRYLMPYDKIVRFEAKDQTLDLPHWYCGFLDTIAAIGSTQTRQAAAAWEEMRHWAEHSVVGKVAKNIAANSPLSQEFSRCG